LKIGPDNAPITVVEFSDFQCPHCRIGAQALHAVLGQHPGKVQLIVKAFPLDRKCNRKIESEMHAFACEAAGTVRCAQEQGKFKEIYEALFENQELLESKGPRAIAIEHGLDAAQLDTCLKNPATQQILTQEIEEGIQLGVAATPTYFVNGHKMEGPNPLAVWNKVIEVLRAP
jgi:protein-disulfide isomerase